MKRKNDTKKDKTLQEKWLTRSGFTESTKVVYSTAFGNYCKYHEMTPEELKKEAEDDLRAGLLPSELRIVDRFYDFLTYIDEKELSPSSKNIYKAGIRSFYRSFFVEIPKIKVKNEKNAPLEKNLWHGFTREEVNRMLKVSSLKNRAIILLICSSGLARNEMMNLKRSNFQDIDNQNIATLRIRREKVGQDFVTFCSPETTKAVQQYLERRTDDNPYLFVTKYKKDSESTIKPLNKNAWNSIFHYLATKLGKEYETEPYQYNKVRSHNFRKFFSSQLLNDGCQKWLVDYMMGHTLSATDRAYFEQNSNKLKELYVKHLHSVTIEAEIHNILSPEANEDLKKLQTENMKLKKQQKLAHEKITEMSQTFQEALDNVEQRVLEKLYSAKKLPADFYTQDGSESLLSVNQ